MKIIFNTDIIGVRAGKKPVKKTIYVEEIEFDAHVFGLINALGVIKKWNGRNAFEIHPQAVSIQRFLKKNRKSVTKFALIGGDDIYRKALADIEEICKKTYCYQGAFIVIEL